MSEGGNTVAEQQQNPIADVLAALTGQESEGGTSGEEKQSDTPPPETPTKEIQEPQGHENLDVQTTEVDTESKPDNAGDSPEVPDDSKSQEPQTTETPWFEKEESSFVTDEDKTDYTALIKDLGWEEGNKSDIISKFKSLEETNQELTEKVKTFEETNLYANDQLKEANSLANGGGDWKQYLGIASTDWDAIDDKTLVVEMKLKDAFGDNQDALNEYLSNMNPYDVKIQGQQIRDSLKADQQHQMQQIQKATAERKLEIDNKIKNSLDKTGEMYGVKFTPTIKTQLFKDITSPGGLVNSIFYDKQGNLNPDAIVATAFASANMKMIMQVNMNRYRNQGKQEILDEVSNPKLHPQGQMPDATPQEKGPLDSMMEQIKTSGPI